MLMFVAGRTPILRGIASIYVFGVYLVSSIVLWGLSIVELRARSTLAFTNMDRYPAQVFFNWGFILFFLWLINRNGVKGEIEPWPTITEHLLTYFIKALYSSLQRGQ